MKYWAHSKNENEKPHYLKEHLERTAQLCESFTSKWGYPALGYFLGLVHDLGKYSEEFQSYLNSFEGKVDHSSLGMYWTYKNSFDFLALAVASHHGGLPDIVKFSNRIEKARKNDLIKKKKNTINRFKKEIDLPSKFEFDVPDFEGLKLEFFIRMCFSALVDADFLDTESHFSPENFELRRANMKSIPQLLEIFKDDQDGLIYGARDTYLNEVRNNIYQTVYSKAEHDQDIFSLTVPTGGGKTRTGIGFALKHAKEHNLDRVIVVIPYTNIIEQTAKEYSDIFGPDQVLEHHSSLTSDGENEAMRLAAENWDMPIVVTTSVQFFESLFSSRTSSCRRLHNIANSVVIFDEVQTLPATLLIPILSVIEELNNTYHTSIIFSTATQPAFKNKENSNQAKLSGVKELAPRPKELFSDLKRVKYNLNYIEEDLNWQEVAEITSEYNQALLVVNAKKQAVNLYEEMTEQKEFEGIFHLSNNMCPLHRKNVLNKVKRRLKEDKNCILVSTQLIEAGVDIDFPIVLRAIGPLDSIVQAAGRCNREGDLENGEVIVYQPEEEVLPPGVYKTATAKTKMLLEKHIDLHNPKVFEEYFVNLYRDIDLDAKGIQHKRSNLKYKEVDKQFKLIPENTVGIIVENFTGYTRKQKEKLNNLLTSIEAKEFVGRQEWRDLQPYTVSIYRHELKKLRSKGLLAEIIEDLYLWGGRYDSDIGLIREVTYSSNDLMT